MSKQQIISILFGLQKQKYVYDHNLTKQEQIDQITEIDLDIPIYIENVTQLIQNISVYPSTKERQSIWKLHARNLQFLQNDQLPLNYRLACLLNEIK